MQSSVYRRVYAGGVRIAGPYFAAFVLKRQPPLSGARVGFTVPRAFGKAVKRNRAKRRLRELLRVRLPLLPLACDLVINPRRQALEATSTDLEREIERLLLRCAKS